MIELLNPTTRKLLVECRCMAMGGAINTALSRLDENLSSQVGTPVERISVAMLKAEILYLDHGNDNALTVFRADIRPVLLNLPEGIQIVVERNENDVKSALLQPGSVEEFYRLVDRQRLLGVELSDLKAILAAEDDAAAQKHHSAFPAFWRELVRAYQQACWRPCCWAAKRLAEEYVRVGLYHEATHHAVMADDKDLAQRVGQRLLGARSADAIRQAVETLLTIANLQRHFTIACETIEVVGDGVPDDQIDRVFQWLMVRCSINPSNLGEMNTLSAAWKALFSIAARLNPDQAQLVVSVATVHRFWSQPHPVYRREMIRVLELCTARLRRQDLALLIDRTLLAVGEAKDDFDYPEALNLLCNASARGSAGLKRKVTRTLFPKGRALDMFLAQAAAVLGREMKNPAEWSKLVERSAQNLRLQVQRLSADEEPAKMFGSFGHFARVDSQRKEKLVIHIASSIDLNAIAAHRHSVPSRSLEQLAQVAIEMLQERENLLSNRELLIAWLARVVDRLTMKTALRAVEVLVPISRGHILEPTAVMSAKEAENPLNAFKLRTGTPTDLRGTALIALAQIRDAKLRLRADVIDKLLDIGLSDSDALIRRSALRAVTEAPRTSRPAVDVLLMATRDPDEDAAAWAYDALAASSKPRFSASQWRQLASSARMALQSGVILRRSAAAAVTKLLSYAPDREAASTMSEVQRAFAEDVCHSVRQAAEVQGGRRAARMAAQRSRSS